MQKLILVGHLGQDAEAKDVGTTQVINFSLAVSEKYKGETKTTWYKVAFWTNNIAVLPYLKKGTLVGVEGTPDIEVYMANDNTPRATMKCNTRDIKLYSSGQNNQAQAAQAPAQKPAAQSPREAFTQAGKKPEFKEEDHDDLPF